jgi:hypothetical protein
MKASSQTVEKVLYGQFYTRVNPFTLKPFREWFDRIPTLADQTFIEPFSGSNSIVKMMLDTYPDLAVSQWSAFDLYPEAQETNLVPGLQLTKRDTIADFPDGYSVCITNPPYLAKNSASRKKLNVNFEGFQDLFEVSLARMLEHCQWVAAIIPESYITRPVLRHRLHSTISLTQTMFDDTEFPVCLALFDPLPTETFSIWQNDTFLGKHADLNEELDNLLLTPKPRVFRFNDAKGILGLYAVDMTKAPSIRFVPGHEIAASDIKHTSRAITRIHSDALTKVDLEVVIKLCNEKLANYRERTKDVFLTSFKGLRDDGKYRRRLDWETAQRIVATSLTEYDPSLRNLIIADPKLSLWHL